jgi:SAM-dependent methyltransferase
MSNICFYLSKKRVLSRAIGDAGENPATFEGKSYQAWRSSELFNQFSNNFNAKELEGLDVLDFGCGEGGLSFIIASNVVVKSITGIDLSEGRVESAILRSQELNSTIQPRFLCASNPSTIDVPDASVDVILCFDVLEHILDYESIVSEWRRVLRNNGKVFIWWVPWYHPYGHHIESLVPLPWVHVIFSDKVLIETCARIYDMPEFKPRLWDLDETGNKKPNKWLNMDTLPDVNRLTITEFENICKKVGLDIAERRINGFGGSFIAKITHIFTHIPVMREFFSSSVIYKLRKQD